MSAERIIISPGWEESLRASGLAGMSAVYAYEGGTLVKRANSTEVRRVSFVAGGVLREVYLKKYWVTKVNQHLSSLFRGALVGAGKARQEFENLERIREWGLDAPRPVAWGEERRCGLLVRSFLISEAVPQALPLDVFIQDRLPTLPPDVRRDLIRRLADYVRRLHSHRFEHHDLYWRNIILNNGELTRFYLIDAHKGRLCSVATEQAGRAQDLAALDAPAPRFFRRTERLRFLLRYLGKRRLHDDGKAFARRVLAVAEPMRERQLKRLARAGK